MAAGNEIQPPTPSPRDSTFSGDLSIATVDATDPPQKRLHPAQTQLPPAYLGFIPAPHAEPLHVDGIENVRLCTIPDITSSDDLVNRPGSNPMLAIWSATMQLIGRFKYLVLPPTDPDGEESKWLEDHHPCCYPSNKIMVRRSYENTFSIFLQENAKLPRRGSHLALGGTSGVGKTFFCRYIIWRLLHPDGIEVKKIPETIFLWTNPKEWKGYLYHQGSFYSITSINIFLSSTLAQNMFDRQDAWMICDGAPPTTYMECPIIVSSSPEKFQSNDISDAKKYFKTANCKVYLPPWTAEEVWAAAQNIYGLTDGGEAHLKERFTMFGGIPRSIFLNFNSVNKPLKNLFVVTDVATALNEAGSTNLKRQKISQMILHLIPDNTLQQVSYQWGSTAIMETAFETMFRVSKKKIQAFLPAGICLHLGTFYGLLFEPYFHAKVTQQGYSGRIRRLTPSASIESAEGIKVRTTTASSSRAKRHWYGTKKLDTEVFRQSIPVQQLHHFHLHGDIQMDKYNIPDRKNFAAVDAVAPALGEMYQITLADTHPIKGIQLRPLKKTFEKYLSTGEKVKLIFIVPPDRFDKFKEQKYIFPRKKEMGKDEVDEYDTAPWDEDELPQDATGEMSNAALLQEVTSWVDQYVMEVSVDPLIKTVDKDVESQMKKSFLQRWRPFVC